MRFTSITTPAICTVPRACARLVICAAIAGLVACGKPAERPPYFELPLPDGGKLRIPDKRPNQYRWHGDALKDLKTGVISSSNLAFRWRTGVAAGGMGSHGPVPVEDLVLFHFQIGEGLTPASFALERVPAFPEGELAPPPHHRAVRYAGTSAVEPWAYNYISDSDASVISCMTAKSAKGGHSRCSGSFMMGRNVKVGYSFMRKSLSEVNEIQLAIKNLITSWKVN